MRISDWSSDVCSSDLSAFALSPRRARILVALLVAIAGFAAWRMVAGWTGRFEGATALWGAAVFAIGLFVIGWRWAFTLVLALLMLGIGGWDTVRESFTDMRVRSYFGVYTVTDDSYRHQRRLAHGTTPHGLPRNAADTEYDPTTYYGHDSGVGLTLDAADRLAGANAAIGLEIGRAH